MVRKNNFKSKFDYTVSGAPMVLSRPHFLDSNVNVDVDGNPVVEGLKPDPKKHEFYIDIFPVRNQPILKEYPTNSKYKTLFCLIFNGQVEQNSARPINERSLELFLSEVCLHLTLLFFGF